MNLPFKPEPRLSYIFPGFMVLLPLIFYQVQDILGFQMLLDFNLSKLISFIFFALLVSIIIGSIIDALRNIMEKLFDKMSPINWDFFFIENPDKVKQFDEYYFSYYTFDINLSISIVIIYIMRACDVYGCGKLPPLLLFTLGVAFIILLADGYDLRKDMKRLLDNEEEILPHAKVYTRLKPSEIHGVGVFAIRHIPKDTVIFSDDRSEIVWIDEGKLKNIDPGLARLYNDFSIIKSGKYGCPKSFNCLTIGWFINESKSVPNVKCTDDYNFIAMRDIKDGEELLADYSLYSEYPKYD